MDNPSDPRMFNEVNQSVPVRTDELGRPIDAQGRTASQRTADVIYGPDGDPATKTNFTVTTDDGMSWE